MIIIFDLDDTLYNEITFVKSGFYAVAKYLQEKYSFPYEKTFDSFWENLQKYGRGKVFDHTLQELGIYSKKEVRKCVSVYRLHNPNISLNPEAEKLLTDLKKYNKYLVTDGNKIVQRNKVKALNLKQYFKKIYITYQYGRKHSKPSPYCFQLIKKQEPEYSYKQMIYIGDNENKDFVGIKPLGIKTIRVKQGMFKDLNLPEKFKAHIEVDSLKDINEKLLKDLIARK